MTQPAWFRLPFIEFPNGMVSYAYAWQFCPKQQGCVHFLGTNPLLTPASLTCAYTWAVSFWRRAGSLDRGRGVCLDEIGCFEPGTSLEIEQRLATALLTGKSHSILSLSLSLSAVSQIRLDSQRVKKLASKLYVHSVNFAAKLVHTIRALSSTVINSHQEPVSGQTCNPLDPHWFFLSFSRWRSFTVLGTKVAPFP